MISLSVNDTTKAAALDSALAFSVVFEEHRLLVSQSVSSGFKGLVNSLDQLSAYSKTVESLQASMESIEVARQKALLNPFSTTGTTANTSTVTAVNSGLNTQGAPYSTTTSNAVTSITTALNGTTAGTPERTAAEEAKAAADKAKAAVDKIRAGNATGGFADAEQALTDAKAAKIKADAALVNANAAKTTAQTNLTTAQTNLTTAQAALTAAQAANPQVPATIAAAQAAVTAAQTAVTNAQTALTAANARVTAATAVVTAAAAVVTAAQGVVDFKAEPICQIKLTTTQKSYDLGDGYTLTSWGSTGYMTLTGSDGKGILIQPDGSVDPLDGAGNGWKFSNTSTFVLPNETKITITPNAAGAVISATKGRNHLELTNIKSGATPDGVITQDGRKYDATTNDGYRIDMGTTTANWTLGANTLGDAGSREQVAATASSNKFVLDASDVEVPSDLKAFLDEIGFDIDQYDSDGDGKLNEEEFFQVASILNTLVTEMQTSFQQVLVETAKASEALMELNQFLEQIQKQGSDEQSNKSEASAAEKDVLASIQKRLESALTNLQALQGGGSGGVGFNDAQQLLINLGKAALGQSYETTGTSALPQVTTPSPSSTQSEETTPSVDPVTQAMRRASLLIGGLKIDESLFPSAPASLPALNAEDVDLLATLASLGLPISGVDAEALLTLVGKLKAELAAGGLATLNGEGLQLLESVKAGLADVGLIGLTEENSQFLSDLTAQLRGLNIGLADTFELEELLGRLRSGPEIAENSSAGTGLSTDVRKLTVADAQRLAAILGRLQNRELGLSPDDLRRIETLQRLLLNELQTESSPAAGGGEFGGRVLTRADIQLFEELMFKLRGEDPDVVPTPSSSSPSVGGNPFLQNLDLLKTIAGNFETDPKLLETLKENVSKSIKTYTEHLNRARGLFVEAQENVQEFVKIVAEDDSLKEIVQDDRLSDEQQEGFADKMRDLHQKWGMDWGSDASTPTEEGKLVTRMAQSGMMI
jgi:hypothetical protein